MSHPAPTDWKPPPQPPHQRDGVYLYLSEARMREVAGHASDRLAEQCSKLLEEARVNLHRSPNFVQVEVPDALWEPDQSYMLRAITPPVVPNPMAWWKDLRAEDRTARIRAARAKVLAVIESIINRMERRT